MSTVFKDVIFQNHNDGAENIVGGGGLYKHIYIYVYTSVNPRISILVSDDTESRQAGLSGAGTVFSNSFFE
jgi:hypothetical protein